VEKDFLNDVWTGKCKRQVTAISL